MHISLSCNRGVRLLYRSVVLHKFCSAKVEGKDNANQSVETSGSLSSGVVAERETNPGAGTSNEY